MLIVADNLRITNEAIARAIKQMDAAPIQEMAKRCQLAGADAIDINCGPLTKNAKKHAAFLVEAVEAACDLPLLLDTVNPKAIAAGLAVAQKPAIINGFSMESGKLAHILPLAKRYDADIIGYLLDSKSRVPTSTSEALSLAVTLYAEFTKVGIDHRHLIIDPVVAPLMWDNGLTHNRALLDVIRTLPELLGFKVRTIAGLSNLTSGQAQRSKKRLLQASYLPMLAASGLDLVMMDVLDQEMVKTAKTCRTLVAGEIFSWAI
jgi:5-methyltetrahydrofolate corrinoid/iron sulfur protein methyltransferase